MCQRPTPTLQIETIEAGRPSQPSHIVLRSHCRTVGHRHWLVAEAAVDLLDGHTDVEHSCDEEVVGVAV